MPILPSMIRKVWRSNIRSGASSADRWADDIRLSDIEPRLVCEACGKRGADVRPDFNWARKYDRLSVAMTARLLDSFGKSAKVWKCRARLSEFIF